MNFQKKVFCSYINYIYPKIQNQVVRFRNTSASLLARDDGYVDSKDDEGGSSRGEARDDLEHVPGGAVGRGQAPCRHLRGGYCTTHGMKGRKYLQPVSVITVGADGRQERKTVRKTKFTCDLGQRGRGRGEHIRVSCHSPGQLGKG